MKKLGHKWIEHACILNFWTNFLIEEGLSTIFSFFDSLNACGDNAQKYCYYFNLSLYRHNMKLIWTKAFIKSKHQPIQACLINPWYALARPQWILKISYNCLFFLGDFLNVSGLFLMCL